MERPRIRARDVIIGFIIGFIIGLIIGYIWAYEECLTMGARMIMRYTNIGDLLNISEEHLKQLIAQYGQ